MTDTPKIFRVSIQVSQIDEAITFYSELLGIKSRSVSASECYFECGAVVLLLSETSRELLQSDQEQVNFSVRDIGAIHARASVLNCLAQGIIAPLIALIKPLSRGIRAIFVFFGYNLDYYFLFI